VTGCQEVSPGCDHCYAKTFAERWRGIGGHPYEQGFDLKLWPERLELPLRWRKPRRVFVNSMSDLFHDGVPDEFIARVFAVMGLAKQHTFQVLTKRPGRMASLLSSADFRRGVGNVSWHGQVFLGSVQDWPLPNVWLGTSVESQKWANVRIPKLLGTPASVRFLSCEPLVGPVDLSEWLDPLEPDGDCEKCGQEWWARFGGHPVLDEENEDTGEWCPGPMRRHSGLDWVIVGGESGPKARPMDLEWARRLVWDCQAGQVAPFVKQLGTVWSAANGHGRTHGGDPEQWPADLRVREFPR
jgi:protein gp37